MKKIYLDCCAINHLLDYYLPDIHKAISDDFMVCLSAINIVEIVKTPDQNRRHKLLSFCNSLNSKNNRPLDFPGDLLNRDFSARTKGEKTLDCSIDQRKNLILSLFKDPSQISNEIIDSFKGDFIKRKNRFINISREARIELTGMGIDINSSEVKSLDSFLHFVFDRSDLFNNFSSELLKSFNYSNYDIKNHITQLKSFEIWKLFGVYIFTDIFKLAIQQNKYSPTWNPDINDLSQIIYFIIVDYFITDDEPLLETVIELQKLNYIGKEKVILNLKEFIEKYKQRSEGRCLTF